MPVIVLNVPNTCRMVSATRRRTKLARSPTVVSVLVGAVVEAISGGHCHKSVILRNVLHYSVIALAAIPGWTIAAPNFCGLSNLAVVDLFITENRPLCRNCIDDNA